MRAWKELRELLECTIENDYLRETKLPCFQDINGLWRTKPWRGYRDKFVHMMIGVSQDIASGQQATSAVRQDVDFAIGIEALDATNILFEQHGVRCDISPPI